MCQRFIEKDEEIPLRGQQHREESHDGNNSFEKRSLSAWELDGLDLSRASRFAMIAFAVTPLAHSWYSFLGRRFTGHGLGEEFLLSPLFPTLHSLNNCSSRCLPRGCNGMAHECFDWANKCVRAAFCLDMGLGLDDRQERHPCVNNCCCFVKRCGCAWQIHWR